jgi:2-polyprenyl-3-methyl-5-hydroxy-6-metoxy-1,4-benzoquinol methylase
MRLLKKIQQITKQILGYPTPIWNGGYDKYWDARRKDGIHLNNFQQRRMELTLPYLASGDRVLDIGAGDGSGLLYLQKQRPGLTVAATDFSDNSLKWLQQAGISAQFLDLTDAKALQQVIDSFRPDHVLLFEILEHIPNPEKVLEILSQSKIKTILFSVPNTGHARHRLRLLLGRFPLQWCTYPGEHLRFWTLADMKWWLSTQKYLPQTLIKPYMGFGFWHSLLSRGLLVVIKKST